MRWGALVLAIAAACSRTADEVVVYTSVDQVFSDPVFRAFEEQSGIRVRAVYDTEETKSTGVLNRPPRDPREAARLGDRIAVLEDGRIVQAGTAAELVAAPATAFVRAVAAGLG